MDRGKGPFTDDELRRIAEVVIEEFERRLQQRAGRGALQAIWTILLIGGGLVLAYVKGWFHGSAD